MRACIPAPHFYVYICKYVITYSYCEELPSGDIVGAEVERVPNINEAEPCSYAKA